MIYKEFMMTHKLLIFSVVVVIISRFVENSFSVSKHSKIKPKCFPSRPELKIDSAIVELQINFTSTFFAQSQNCDQCSLMPICTPFINNFTYIMVNTTFHTKLNLYSYGDRVCKTDVSYHFGEFGVYKLDVNKNTGHCSVHVVKAPQYTHLPVLYAFLILVLIFILYHGFMTFFRYFVRSCSFNEGTPICENPDIVDSTGPIVYNEIITSVHVHKSQRLVSLDVFRGICICIMIFVNYGGGKYWYFTHSAWNGITLADVVFPWFMFIMGTSIAFSFESQLRKNMTKSAIVRKIVQRCAVLFAIGLFIVNHNFNLIQFRIPGVLQKIAASYCFVSILRCLTVKPACVIKEYINHQNLAVFHLKEFVFFCIEWLVMFIVVFVWLMITFLLPVPGCPTGYLGPGGMGDYGKYPNCTGGAAGLVDRFIFGSSRIYQHPTCRFLYNSEVPFDPEGALGTLMSIFAVFLGLQAGNVLLLYPHVKDRIFRLTVLSIFCGVLAGGLCSFTQFDGIIPVNKNLWSLSFVLCLASLGFLLLLLLHLIIDVFKFWQGAPFYFVGMNSILLYVGHEVFEDYFPFNWSPAPQTHAGYLAMNLSAVSIWIIIAYLLHRKKYYLSV